LIIYAVYIISIDGLPIVSEKFQSAESIPNEVLLAGLFTAIQGVMSEVTHKRAKLDSINVDNLSYHFKSFGKFQLVLVTNLSATPNNILQRLGFRFMKDYGEQLMDDKPNRLLFEPFVQTINEIINEETKTDSSRLINPTKKFSPKELYKLPQEVRIVALSMITLKEGNIDQIASESKISKGEAKHHLQTLQNLGFIGKKITQDDSFYFCSV